MTSVAQIQIPDLSWTFLFSIATVDGGYIRNYVHPTVSEIVTHGTDARRFRLERSSFPDFTMRTVCDYATYSDAIADAGRYEQSIGQVASLAMAASNYSAVSYNVQIVNVVPQVKYAFVGGNVISSSATPSAMLSAMWNLVCTEAS